MRKSVWVRMGMRWRHRSETEPPNARKVIHPSQQSADQRFDSLEAKIDRLLEDRARG